MTPLDRDERKKVLSWGFYDWANSAYATTVMAGFFPVFFKNYWSQGFSAVDTTAKLATTVSVSSLLIALISPTLGAVADHKNQKKMFLIFFMLIGVMMTAWLAFIPAGSWFVAAFVYGIGMMAYNASCVFCDALLPSVARKQNLDFASSLGYAMGYLGGGILFAINVFMYLKPELFGFTSGVAAVQFSFISVAVWWFVFSVPLMFFVKEDKQEVSSKQSWWDLTCRSFLSLRGTLREIRQDKNLFLFMVAFWLYIDGVYTVITMAVDYGISLNFESKDLIAALLITQFVGFPATYVYGAIAKKWGCRKPILFCIIVYALTVILASQMRTPMHFYILAAVIGLVQGGVQSLSRSLFAKMISEEKSGEYFGFMNLIGKFASVLGPVIVALTVLIVKKSEYGLMGLIVLFAAGGYLLMKVDEPRDC
ncbi:MAG: MFS transporter [Bdellovibrionaceae bacterium]|nr:MFS transporter [Pseudobdellovibrionaceae bacterium]